MLQRAGRAGHARWRSAQCHRQAAPVQAGAAPARGTAAARVLHGRSRRDLEVRAARRRFCMDGQSLDRGSNPARTAIDEAAARLTELSHQKCGSAVDERGRGCGLHRHRRADVSARVQPGAGGRDRSAGEQQLRGGRHIGRRSHGGMDPVGGQLAGSAQVIPLMTISMMTRFWPRPPVRSERCADIQVPVNSPMDCSCHLQPPSVRACRSWSWILRCATHPLRPPLFPQREACHFAGLSAAQKVLSVEAGFLG